MRHLELSRVIISPLSLFRFLVLFFALWLRGFCATPVAHLQQDVEADGNIETHHIATPGVGSSQKSQGDDSLDLPDANIRKEAESASAAAPPVQRGPKQMEISADGSVMTQHDGVSFKDQSNQSLTTVHSVKTATLHDASSSSSRALDPDAPAPAGIVRRAAPPGDRGNYTDDISSVAQLAGSSETISGGASSTSQLGGSNASMHNPDMPLADEPEEESEESEMLMEDGEHVGWWARRRRAAFLPVHCKVGAWGPWQGCPPPKDCVPGVSKKTRARIIVTRPLHGGKMCPRTSETLFCVCPKVDCKMGNWEGWSDCPTSWVSDCPNHKRTRAVQQEAKNGGTMCPKKEEKKKCKCATTTTTTTSTTSTTKMLVKSGARGVAGGMAGNVLIGALLASELALFGLAS